MLPAYVQYLNTLWLPLAGAVLGGALYYFLRRMWLAAPLATILPSLFTHAPTSGVPLLALLYLFFGFLGAVVGWAIINHRPRIGVLTAVWVGACLVLLAELRDGPGITNLVFLATIVILGGISVFAVPPVDGPDA